MQNIERLSIPDKITTDNNIYTTKGNWILWVALIALVVGMMAFASVLAWRFAEESVKTGQRIDKLEAHVRYIGESIVSKEIQIQRLQAEYGGLRRDLYQGWTKGIK